MLYRAVVSGTAEKDRVLFESPIGKVWFDRVDNVSGQLQPAQVGSNAEFSMPLSALSLSPKSGESVLADFGILRGDGTQTIQRLYWNNLNTSIVSDIPSEARPARDPCRIRQRLCPRQAPSLLARTGLREERDRHRLTLARTVNHDAKPPITP